VRQEKRDDAARQWLLVTSRSRRSPPPPAFRSAFNAPSPAKPAAPLWLGGRCFCCHSKRHQAWECRDPIHCNNCWRSATGSVIARRSCATSPVPASHCLLLCPSASLLRLLHHRRLLCQAFPARSRALSLPLLRSPLCKWVLLSGCLGRAHQRQGRPRTRSSSTPPRRCYRRPRC
jgi:hypothetical protein